MNLLVTKLDTTMLVIFDGIYCIEFHMVHVRRLGAKHDILEPRHCCVKALCPQVRFSHILKTPCIKNSNACMPTTNKHGKDFKIQPGTCLEQRAFEN